MSSGAVKMNLINEAASEERENWKWGWSGTPRNKIFEKGAWTFVPFGTEIN